MKTQSYHFEVKDIITQFISAFNDVVVNRYNKSREVVDKIHVRYLYAPKERVLNDLINKSQHVTLPAVSVSISSISRDENRVFNKLLSTQVPTADNSATVKDTPPPVPVNIEVDMSMITKYQTDMDQILSNFIPYTNPYIVISWPVPATISNQLEEIRTEVLWSGNISLTYPTELNASDRYRVTADTSFTIKGWLFPGTSNTSSNIFYVETNFTPVTGFDYI